DQRFAAVKHVKAERGDAVRIAAFEVASAATLAIERDGETLAVAEPLLVVLARRRRAGIVVAVVEREQAVLAGLGNFEHERHRAGLIEVAIPVRLEIEMDRSELG